MSACVVADVKIRSYLAEKWRPRIYQEFQSIFDLLSPICVDKVENVIEDFAIITGYPTLYHGVREDRCYWYVYYLVYHPFDVSAYPVKLVRKLDFHRHDTEAILLRIEKANMLVDMVTVNHYSFKCQQKTMDRRVVIEANGHGIRPYASRGPKGNYLTYKVFDYIDLLCFSTAQWEALRRSFNGVSMPDEQYDTILCGSPSGRRVNKRGDIWLRPDRLFKSLELIGRF